MKAVAYCRVARHEDNNIEKQIEHLRSYAEQQNYELIHTYADVGSGFESTVETGLMQLLKASKEENFDVVIIKDFNRFSRDSKKAREVLTILQNNGKKIQVAMQERIEGTQSNDIENFFNTFIGFQGTLFRQRLRLRRFK